MYGVSAAKKAGVLEFLLEALNRCGCSIVYAPPANSAPYRIIFDTPQGERLGVVAYAFFANTKATRNRPDDEHRFQVKYGGKNGALHTIWQDPYGLYTTLFLGVDPEAGIFVAADPVLHSPTKFFISIEFKRSQVEVILKKSWHSWERVSRSKRAGFDNPVEVLIGGTADSFLRYVRFEREALGEDQGHRQLLAEQAFSSTVTLIGSSLIRPSEQKLHQLSTEFELASDEILGLISTAKRLKMAVRGWVAEKHLEHTLKVVPDVTDCRRLDVEGSPDISLRYKGSRPISIECKNVLRNTAADGSPRIDFQRTRASKADPCSRYYKSSDFEIVAACLHAVTQKWEYRFVGTSSLRSHPKCSGRIASNVRVDAHWRNVESISELLDFAATRS